MHSFTINSWISYNLMKWKIWHKYAYALFSFLFRYIAIYLTLFNDNENMFSLF